MQRCGAAGVALALAACVCVAAGDEDFYGLLGVPRSAATGDITKAYHKLSRKWNPDKWFAEGGAFEGIEPANVLVDEADEAKAHFYKLSRAHKVLTDDAHRRIYDESLGDGGEWLLRPAAPAASAITSRPGGGVVGVGGATTAATVPPGQPAKGHGAADDKVEQVDGLPPGISDRQRARTLRPQSKRGYRLEIEPASDDEEGEDEPDAPETQLRAVLPKHLSSPRGA